MKRKLLLFTLAGLLSIGVLSSCGGTSSTSIPTPGTSTPTPTTPAPTTPTPSTPTPSTPVVTTIEISNKDTLIEEWHARGADRLISFKVFENGVETPVNQNALVNGGQVVITSSDTNTISVSGRYISALNEGTTTITITYLGATDSVTIVTLPKIGAPDFIYGKTLAEIFAEEDTDGINAYVTSGIVSSAYYADGFGTDGRFNVYDVNDTSATKATYIVYGCATEVSGLGYDTTTSRFKVTPLTDWKTNEQTKDIKVGDKINFIVTRSDYGSTKEVKALLLAVNGSPIFNGTKTVSELLEIEADATYLYKVTGTISGYRTGYDNFTRYGNFMLKDEDDKEILVYGATASASALQFNETTGKWAFSNPQDFDTNGITSTLAIGDEITLIGYRLDHNDILEFTGIIPNESDTIPEPAVKTVTSLTDILEDKAANMSQKYSLNLYVTGWGSKTAANEFGELNVDDDLKSDPVLVYGSTATDTAITYSETSGTYAYRSPRDFLSNATTSTIAVGSKITVEALRSEFSGNPQLYCIIKSVGTDDRKTEPATKTVASIKEATDDTAELMTQTFIVTGYISKWYNDNTNATRYGNYYITDANGDNEILVYGSTVAGSLVYNYSTGLYKLDNSRDFLENDLTKNAAIGSKVTLKVCITTYNNAKQFTGVVTALTADDRTA